MHEISEFWDLRAENGLTLKIDLLGRDLLGRGVAAVDSH